MKLRLAIFFMLGLCYYGYIRSTADLALVRLEAFQTSYLRAIETYSMPQN
jgi:hypothetical protein